jgi:hypothetical protein
VPRIPLVARTKARRSEIISSTGPTANPIIGEVR